MTRVDAFVDKHGWQIVVGLVSAVIAFGALQAQVRKIEDIVKTKVTHEDLDAVGRKVDAVLYLVCKDHKTDSVCR